MLKKIFVHAGLPKTGTSYLQSCLDRLSIEKKLSNTDYPVSTTQINDIKIIQSGNAAEIAFELMEDVVDFSESRLRFLIAGFISRADISKQSILMSSERFASALPERLNVFRRILLEYAVSVELIIFVRPLSDLCISSYHQLIKRHGGSFVCNDDFFTKFSSKLLSQIDTLSSVFSDARIGRYKSSGLLGELLGIIGEDAALDKAFNNQKVNRSLTKEELNVLNFINSLFKDEMLSTRISDRWIYESPDVVSDRGGLDVDRLHSIFKMRLSEFNPELKNSSFDNIINILVGEVVEIEQYNNVLDEAGVARTPVNTNLEVDLLFSAIQEIKEHFYPDILLKNYISTLSAGAQRFDAVHYLLLNRDVLAAGVDPFAHYDKFGRGEGRKTEFIINKLI